MQHTLSLKKRLDFKAVQRRGRSWSNQWFILKALPNRQGNPRFGFSISARMGKAVKRNKLKRWLREAVRPQGIAGDWDLVFIARAGAMPADFATVQEAVVDLLRRGKLLPEPEREAGH